MLKYQKISNQQAKVHVFTVQISKTEILSLILCQRLLLVNWGRFLCFYLFTLLFLSCVRITNQSYGKCIFEILTTTNLFSAVPDPEQLYQDSFIVIPEQHGHLSGNPVNLGYDALPQYSQYPQQQEQIQVKRSTTTSRKTRKSKEKRTASINYG